MGYVELDSLVRFPDYVSFSRSFNPALKKYFCRVTLFTRSARKFLSDLSSLIYFLSFFVNFRRLAVIICHHAARDSPPKEIHRDG